MFQAGNVVEHIVTGLRYLVSEVVDNCRLLISDSGFSNMSVREVSPLLTVICDEDGV